jgi:NitT/TauT family transport system substrate-binding protein
MPRNSGHTQISRRAFTAGLGAAAGALPLGSQGFAEALAPSVNIAYATVVQSPLLCYYNSVPMTLYWPTQGFKFSPAYLAGANTAAEMLESGRVDMAFVSNSAYFALLDKYPKSDIVAIYTFTTGFNAMPTVKVDSPIKTIADLAGKKIGVLALANSQVQVTKALVAMAGADPASLQFIPVGEGPEAAHALQQNRVDAIALFDGLYAQIEAIGVPLREVAGGSIDLDQIGFISSILTTHRYLKSNRATLVHLLKGIAKATVFTKANTEAAIRIHWKVYPETKQRGIDEAEAMRRTKLQVIARQRNVRDVEGLIGNSTAQQIKTYQEVLMKGGVIKKAIEPERLWDGSLIKDVNDFDRKAIEEQAKSWKG